MQQAARLQPLLKGDTTITITITFTFTITITITIITTITITITVTSNPPSLPVRLPALSHRGCTHR